VDSCSSYFLKINRVNRNDKYKHKHLSYLLFKYSETGMLYIILMESKDKYDKTL